MKTFDLNQSTVRELNQALHDQAPDCAEREFDVLNPNGRHNIACGIDQNLQSTLLGMPVITAPA